ncbi:MAG: NAD(P)-dependent oxidoreductase [Acidimicrobiales bacterium]|nr:NAD(P)-dependent oxidoreductase [Acidimicrobiales bacterium]
MLEGERILVTGATGQVARPIAEALQRAGNEVWAGARFTDPTAKAELEAQGIRTAVFTLGDPDLDHLPAVDYVIHCAVNNDPKTPDDALRINADGAGFLMRRYRDATAFFHMSSSSVYRDKDDPAALYAEDDDLGGTTPYAPHYGMSKLASEAVVRFQSRELGLPTIMARLNVAYGTSGHGGLPMVFHEFMKAGMPYQKIAGQDAYASPIHEDDIVAQVQGLLAHAAVGAPAVNLAGDEVVTLEEIIAHLEDLTGLSMTFTESDHLLFHTHAADTTKRRELAGPCAVTWRDGVRAALETRYPDAIRDDT